MASACKEDHENVKGPLKDHDTGAKICKSSSNMHFTISKHSKDSLEVMNNLRDNRKLCDCILSVGMERFHVHKIVLAAASPYFRAMFTSGMKEEGMIEIPLHMVNVECMKTLINFAYTSELMISESNVCRLLSAATLFQMCNVMEACCMFLEHQLEPNNCIGISDFAKEHGCMELYGKTCSFIQRHFSDVSQGDEFLDLNAIQLALMIKDDGINVKCESEIYDAIVRWVSHDEDQRLTNFHALLSAVRCQHLPPKFLDRVLKHCRYLQNCKYSYKYLSDLFRDLSLQKQEACQEQQRLSCRPSAIYVAGGYLRQSLSNFECYKPSTNQWFRMTDLSMPRSGSGCCVLGGLLYIIGGRNNSPDGYQDSNEVIAFDYRDTTWKSRANLSVPRNRVGVGTLSGFIYAVGGTHGAVNHCSVERYDPDTDQWSSIPDMSTLRIGAGVGVANNLLFAVGGFDGRDRLNSVECYCPHGDLWHLVAPMNTRRSGAGVATVNNYIYVVGGYNNITQLNTAEMYNFEADQWTFIANMNVSRSALGAATLHCKLYALGGYDGTHFLSSVEMYDPKTDVWTEVTNMTCGRSGHGVAVGCDVTGKLWPTGEDCEPLDITSTCASR